MIPILGSIVKALIGVVIALLVIKVYDKEGE